RATPSQMGQAVLGEGGYRDKQYMDVLRARRDMDVAPRGKRYPPSPSAASNRRPRSTPIPPVFTKPRSPPGPDSKRVQESPHDRPEPLEVHLERIMPLWRLQRHEPRLRAAGPQPVRNLPLLLDREQDVRMHPDRQRLRHPDRGQSRFRVPARAVPD